MHRRPRVALDVVLTAPLGRRQARRLARTLEHAVERVGELGRRPRVLERLAGGLRVAAFERAAHLLEHRGELGQRRLDCAAQCRDRVAGHGDQHGEPHAAADERVDEPIGPGAGARSAATRMADELGRAASQRSSVTGLRSVPTPVDGDLDDVALAQVARRVRASRRRRPACRSRSRRRARASSRARRTRRASSIAEDQVARVRVLHRLAGDDRRDLRARRGRRRPRRRGTARAARTCRSSCRSVNWRSGVSSCARRPETSWKHV